MRVIKKGNEREKVCPYCKSTLLYTVLDVHDVVINGSWKNCIVCPECDKNIEIL